MVNLSEMFRSIFGLRPDILPRSSEEDLKKLYENIPDSIWHQQPPTLHGEWRIFDDHQDHHHDGFSFGEGDFFQEFEEMLQNFFRGSPFHSGPQLKAPPLMSPDTDVSPEAPEKNIQHDSGQSLQDRMLRRPDKGPGMKHSDSQLDHHAEVFPLPLPPSLFGNWRRLPFGGLHGPEEKVDRDLDSELESGTQCLDDILAQKDEDRSPSCAPGRSSSSSSFSSVTIIGSNGVTEQRTTKRDSSGKEEVSVTRRIGDQTHTLTRKKDESGNEETREDLLNIDHDKLVEFDEKWNESKRQGKSCLFLEGDDSCRQPMPLSSIYDAILDQFLPKRR